jgi:dethiobiotin synthetase
MPARIFFVVGTDTGVGKTVFSALLAYHLKRSGRRVKVAKPFCSGGREDVTILAQSVGFEGNLDLINPFSFALPVSPLVAARSEGRVVSLDDTMGFVRSAASEAEDLVLEGAGGLLSPLGECFDSTDILEAIEADPILVAKNRIGVVNQVLLSLRELERSGHTSIGVVLMGEEIPGESGSSNVGVIRECAPTARVFELPYLGGSPVRGEGLKKNHTLVEKVLATLVGYP